MIILFPGFIGYKVYKRLCNAGFRNRNIKNWEDFINILSISLFSYSLMKFFAYMVKNLNESRLLYKLFSKTTMLDALLDSKIVISYQEIFISMVTAIILGIIGAIFFKLKSCCCAIIFKGFLKFVNETKIQFRRVYSW